MSNNKKKNHANNNSHRDQVAKNTKAMQQESIAKKERVQKPEASLMLSKKLSKKLSRKFDIKLEIKKCAAFFRALWRSIKAIPSVSLSMVKIAVSGVACVAVIAGVVIAVRNKPETIDVPEQMVPMTESVESIAEEKQEPLQQDSYPAVNELMAKFYKALADGDMDTVRSIKDYSADTEIITYEKKGEFIESYDNLVCYTKSGFEENSYFVYVGYDVKFKDIETTAPGLNAWYVYTDADGSLKIDGDMNDLVSTMLQEVTAHDDVVDLFNKVDVEYKEAVEQDEALQAFLVELPGQVKTSVGEALAKLEGAEESAVPAMAEPVESHVTEEQTSQKVKATATVNVRMSDSSEADKLGKLQAGEVVTRVEQKLNGWSKIIFEGKEAYVKSDYLELVSQKAEGEAVGKVIAKTNVNVRNSASAEGDKLGMAQADSKFDLLEDLGEWYKINYNGQAGFVKSEYFNKQ